MKRFLHPSLKKTKSARASGGKQPQARELRGVFSLPFMLAAFVLVAAASLILLRGSVRGLSSPAFFESSASFFLLFAVPLALVSLGLALFYALASQLLKTGRVHPSALRNFCLVCAFAILASALFCVFANTLLKELFPFYHDDSIEAALEGAEQLAQSYAAARFLQAETAAAQFFTGLNIHNVESSPRTWLSSIRNYDPSALAVQVYRIDDETGNLLSIKEEGDSSAFLSAEEVTQMADGSRKHEDGEGRALIRVKKTVRYSGLVYAALYTSLFPQEIDEALFSVERAKARFAVVLKAEPLFPYFGFWLYFSFILPPLLVLLLCALYAFVRFADPLASLEEACENLLQGRAGTALVPQKYAWLDNTVRFVNAKSDAIDSALELEAAKAAAQEKEEKIADNAYVKEESSDAAKDAADSEGEK